MSNLHNIRETPDDRPPSKVTLDKDNLPRLDAMKQLLGLVPKK